MEFEEHEVTSDQNLENEMSEEGDFGNDEPDTKRKKKVTPNFNYGQEGPIQKNQIRDKAARNAEKDEKDERKIKNISEIKNKIRRNEEWLKLKREKEKR